MTDTTDTENEFDYQDAYAHVDHCIQMLSGQLASFEDSAEAIQRSAIAHGIYALMQQQEAILAELRKLTARSESFATEARAFEERSSSERPAGERSDS
jgi:hypothetical protein